VISDLVDQITKKSIELSEIKQEIESAFKTAAEAKTSLAQCQLEKMQLEEIIEQLRN